jgi:integrase/recombinase XerC
VARLLPRYGASLVARTLRRSLATAPLRAFGSGMLVHAPGAAPAESNRELRHSWSRRGRPGRAKGAAGPRSSLSRALRLAQRPGLRIPREDHAVSEPKPGLTLREIASMLDAAVRDGTSKAELLGQEVQRFLLYLRGARDASQRTIEDYESVLSRFVAEHAHLELSDFEGALGAERVLEFVSRHWGASAPGTRRKTLSIFASFFAWAARFDRIVSNPMAKLDRPRRRSVERHAHSIAKVKAIIAAQPLLRDRVALSLMALLGLRKNEVRLLRWRDVDLERGEIRVRGKGGKIADVPIVYNELLADLARLSLEAQAAPDDYLLYPVRTGNAVTKLHLRGVVREHRDRPMQPSTMHRWFKRCLRTAGAADFPMHELRHTAGNEFRRATGDLELTRLFMRHASISTTSEHYMHADREELEAGMRLLEERWKKE